MSRESKLVKNTLILSIGTFLPKMAAFVTLPILTAYLSKEQYGTYDLITILVSLLLPVTTLQIHTAAFRFLIEHKNDRNLARTYLSNILAFVVPVSIVTLSVMYFVFPLADAEVKLWTCIYLFFDTIVCEARQIARGMARNLDYSISAIVSAVTKLVLAYLLVASFGMELLGAIISLAVSSILSLLYLFFKLRMYELIDIKALDKRVLREMLAYSWPMVPNNMSSWVMRASDRVVVTAFLGVTSNAVYAVANKIPSLLMLAQTTFAMAWQENASIASGDNDAGAYYTRMFSAMTNFYAGSLGLLIATTPLLFRIVIRGDYWDAYQQMPLLFLAMFFNCMSSFLGGIYIALKATKSVGVTTIVAALCNIVADLALIQRIGIYAASISTLVSYIALLCFRMIDIKKLINLRYNKMQLIAIICLLTCETFLFYLNTSLSNMVNLLLGVIMFYRLMKPMIVPLMKKAKGY